jgi:hypothetical protein
MQRAESESASESFSPSPRWTNSPLAIDASGLTRARVTARTVKGGRLCQFPSTELSLVCPRGPHPPRRWAREGWSPQ